METQRRKILKINIDFYILFTITFLLSVLGIVMISSASTVIGERFFNDPFWFSRRQIIWWVISFAAMMVLSRINYRVYGRMSALILLISIALLALVLIPGFSQEVGGATRWLNLGFFTVQPSEIAKFALVVYFAHILNKKYSQSWKAKHLFVPGFLVLLLITLLIFLEPDLGTAAVIWIIVFIVLFVGGVKFGHLIGIGSIGALMMAVYMFLSEYQLIRLWSFLDRLLGRSSELSAANFQVSQSLIALGSGNIIGLGLGNSLQKYSYLPEAHTDFIFAIIGEEFGLVGTLLVIVLFLLFTFLGIRICIRSKDYFGRVLAAGLTAMISVPAIVNTAVVTGLLPVTGLALPFISSGGSSLLISMGSVGVLLNISRQNMLAEPKEQEEDAHA